MTRRNLPPAPEDRWGRWYGGRGSFGDDLWARPFHAVERHPDIELLSPSEAVSECERGSVASERIIRSLDELAGGPDPSDSDPERRFDIARRRVCDALSFGSIVLHRARTEEFGTGTEVAIEPMPVGGAKAERAWIEVELRDEHTGKPMPGEEVRIVTPSGEVHLRRTDERGLLRLEGLDPGVCDVSFPGIDAREWRRS